MATSNEIIIIIIIIGLVGTSPPAKVVLLQEPLGPVILTLAGTASRRGDILGQPKACCHV